MDVFLEQPLSTRPADTMAAVIVRFMPVLLFGGEMIAQADGIYESPHWAKKHPAFRRITSCGGMLR